MTVFETVKDIIEKELSPKVEITMESKLKDDLGADSIDAVQIVMDLEDTYGISIDEDSAEAMLTVGDVVNYIEANK